jgi:hypothetical protein
MNKHNPNRSQLIDNQDFSYLNSKIYYPKSTEFSRLSTILRRKPNQN